MNPTNRTSDMRQIRIPAGHVPRWLGTTSAFQAGTQHDQE